jgi:hypothetical protein
MAALTMAIATFLGSVWSRKAVEVIIVRDPRYFTVVVIDSNPTSPLLSKRIHYLSLSFPSLCVAGAHRGGTFSPFMQMFLT